MIARIRGRRLSRARFSFLIASGAVLGVTAGSSGQALSQNLNQTSGPRPAVERYPQYPMRAPVPEEVLDDSPQVIVLPTEPAEFGEAMAQRSGGAVGQVPAELRRLPEGYIVAGRQARVEQQEPWVVAHLAPAPGLPESNPLRILPNPRLATLQAVLSPVGGTGDFLLTGRVTEFHGNNYLLIENLAQVVLPPLPATPAPPAEPAAAAPASAELPADDAAPPEPTAEEVLRELMASEPRRAVALPEQIPVTEAEQMAPESARDGLSHDDTPVVNQAGRIVADGAWWLFAFEDPGFTPRTRPIRVLPNQLLETALAITGGGTRPVVLIVSGEITTHQGTDYLLLRKVLLRRNYGNFR